MLVKHLILLSIPYFFSSSWIERFLIFLYASFYPGTALNLVLFHGMVPFSDPFPVSNGVRQGGVLLPVLFTKGGLHGKKIFTEIYRRIMYS